MKTFKLVLFLTVLLAFFSKGWAFFKDKPFYTEDDLRYCTSLIEKFSEIVFRNDVDLVVEKISEEDYRVVEDYFYAFIKTRLCAGVIYDQLRLKGDVSFEEIPSNKRMKIIFVTPEFYRHIHDELIHFNFSELISGVDGCNHVFSTRNFVECIRQKRVFPYVADYSGEVGAILPFLHKYREQVAVQHFVLSKRIQEKVKQLEQGNSECNLCLFYLTHGKHGGNVFRDLRTVTYCPCYHVENKLSSYYGDFSLVSLFNRWLVVIDKTKVLVDRARTFLTGDPTDVELVMSIDFSKVYKKISEGEKVGKEDGDYEGLFYVVAKPLRKKFDKRMFVIEPYVLVQGGELGLKSYFVQETRKIRHLNKWLLREFGLRGIIVP